MSSTFHINTFRSRWEGGARPTLFKVRIPTLPPDISQEQLGDLEVFVKATTLPSFIVQPITMNYMGAPLQYAGNRVYQNWTVTVLNDENFVYRDMFEAWSNKTLALISNRQTAVDNLVDYKVDSQVLQYGKAGPGDDSGIIRGYQMLGIWPIEVSSIGLDWDRRDSIEMFDVTFALDAFEPMTIGQSTPSYSGTIAPDPTSGS